jgi:uncharacterized damage-inducible protein DinB
MAERLDWLWEGLAADPGPPDRLVPFRKEMVPAATIFAQYVHHGSEHRSQVATILTSFGVEPPRVDVWGFAAAGRT